MTVSVVRLSEDGLKEELAGLVQLEPRFNVAVEATGMPDLRARPDGFWALVKSIVSQQLSVQAAATIAGRLETAGLTTPEAVRAAGDDELRGLGLSRQKVRYVRAVAEADVDFVALRAMPTGDVVDTLVALPGIGLWTAEIYCMFALKHADAFAAGDLALQEGARILLGLDDRPSERQLRTLAEAWSPHRGTAARLLWAYYGVQKRRESTPNA